MRAFNDSFKRDFSGTVEVRRPQLGGPFHFMHHQSATRGRRQSSYGLGFSVLMGGTITWPSLKTARNTEANAGSARIASATLNDGSGFHSAPLLTSDSAAAFIA